MSNRIERANSEIQRCLAAIVQKLNDPRLTTMIFISDVKVTPDFAFCKVKFSLDTTNENEIKKTLQILQKSEGHIKKQLANLVKMPKVPKITFEYDKGAIASIRIEQILKTLDIPPAPPEE